MPCIGIPHASAPEHPPPTPTPGGGAAAPLPARVSPRPSPDAAPPPVAPPANPPNPRPDGPGGGLLGSAGPLRCCAPPATAAAAPAGIACGRAQLTSTTFSPRRNACGRCLCLCSCLLTVLRPMVRKTPLTHACELRNKGAYNLHKPPDDTEGQTTQRVRSSTSSPAPRLWVAAAVHLRRVRRLPSELQKHRVRLLDVRENQVEKPVVALRCERQGGRGGERKLRAVSAALSRRESSPEAAAPQWWGAAVSAHPQVPLGYPSDPAAVARHHPHAGVAALGVSQHAERAAANLKTASWERTVTSEAKRCEGAGSVEEGGGLAAPTLRSAREGWARRASPPPAEPAPPEDVCRDSRRWC